jgi:hypothetical protein
VLIVGERLTAVGWTGLAIIAAVLVILALAPAHHGPDIPVHAANVYPWPTDVLSSEPESHRRPSLRTSVKADQDLDTSVRRTPQCRTHPGDGYAHLGA